MSEPSDTPQNEDALIVGRDSLSERLLISKARRYASTLEGVDAYQVVLLDDETLAWQRLALARMRSFEDVGLQARLAHPVAPAALQRAIIALTGLTEAFSGWVVYEGVVGVALQGSDFDLFLQRYLASHSSCDLSLAIESPEAVLCVNDNEHDVTLHYLRG
ncbi:hypothetical protein [Pseudomonas sp. NPDC089406]|uniref:hypothetical protein n=1 Tax=Pseudomonas sp. NPDC089406 TaxID=3364463 RepID=UPI003850B513